MKKLKSIILPIALLMLATFTISSCQEVNDWDVDSSYDGLFSPTKGSVSADATEADLTWTGNSEIEYYIIEVSPEPLNDGIAMGSTNGSIVYGEDKSITKSPYTMTGLESSTEYYLRIKGFSSTTESKWAYLGDDSFTTRAEQLIRSLTAGHNYVTVIWPANSTVTRIDVYKGSELVTTKELNSTEIAAGEATVDGLESETVYSVELMNGSKLRGIRSIETEIDTEGATVIKPGDDIAAILADAEDGEVYVMLPGTYELDEKIVLTSTIAIKAAKSGQTTINGLAFDLKAGVGLELKELVLNGTETSNILINYSEELTTSETPELIITGCDIQNYTGGFINQRQVVEVKAMTITGNIFNKIGGRFVDIQKGYAKEINISNNTIANSGTGDAFMRIDNSAGGFANVRSVITFNSNTFYKVFTNGATRFIYVRLSGNDIRFTNNLMTYSPQAGFSDQSTTIVTEMSNNYYFEAGNFMLETNRVHDANGTVLDPEFVDPENGDFTPQNRTIVNENIGDPRWLN